MKLVLIAIVALTANGACLKLSTDKIRVGDLARALPAFAAADLDQVISFSPVPLVQRVFTARELVQLGRRFRVQIDATSVTNVCFEREAAPLGKEQIESAVLEALNRDDVEIDVVDFGRAVYPSGKLSFSLNSAVRPQESQADEPTIWRGILKTNEGQSFGCWAKVRVTLEGLRVVAKRQIKKGDLIKDDDIALLGIKYSPLLDPYLASIEQVAGKISKRDLTAGGRLVAADLEEPKHVLGGDFVHVTSGTDQAVITFDAQAQTGGRKGDIILVQNPANGRNFKARITAKGEVRAFTGLIP